MEENKVTYLPVWERYLELFRDTQMTKEEIGTMLLAMMEYQFEGKEPEGMGRVLTGFWHFFRKDLDDARARYMQSVNNGKKGAAKQKENRARKLAEEALKAAEHPETTPEHPDHTPIYPEATPTYPETTPIYPETPREVGKSRSMSRSISRSMTKTEQCHPAPAHGAAGGDVSLSKKTYGEFGWVTLTEKEHQELTDLMGAETLRRCIAYIDESAQTTNNRNNWYDWHLVLRRCYQYHWHESGKHQSQPPKGASGQLGEAELEAIRAVLAT